MFISKNFPAVEMARLDCSIYAALSHVVPSQDCAICEDCTLKREGLRCNMKQSSSTHELYFSGVCTNSCCSQSMASFACACCT